MTERLLTDISIPFSFANLVRAEQIGWLSALIILISNDSRMVVGSFLTASAPIFVRIRFVNVLFSDFAEISKILFPMLL